MLISLTVRANISLQKLRLNNRIDFIGMHDEKSHRNEVIKE